MEEQKRDIKLRLVNGLFSPFRLAVVKARRLVQDAQERQTARQLLQLHAQAAGKKCDWSMAGIVFSKDRALQLHALLSSYFEQVSDPAPLTVLYAASSPVHQSAYMQVFKQFGVRPVEAVFEDGTLPFKEQFVGIIDRTKASRIFFLVDDILFIRPVRFSDFRDFDPRNSIPSLRLGTNLRSAYTTQQTQPLPVFREISQDIIEFDWRQGHLDWGYPLSVDGHIFWTPEIRLLAKSLDYRSPNTLEAVLQQYLPYFNWRPGLCYKKSRTLNIPANKVQQDNPNLHGSIHQDYLLEQWQGGRQMDYQAWYGFENISCHQEVEIELINRAQEIPASRGS